MKIPNFCKKKIGNRFTGLLILELLLIFLIVICLICLICPIWSWSDLDNFFAQFVNILTFLACLLTAFAFILTGLAYKTTQEQLKQAKKESAASEINNAWAVLSRPASGNSGKIEALETLAKHEKKLIGIDLSATKNNGRVWLQGLDLSKDTHGHPVNLGEANFSGRIGNEGENKWIDGANLQNAKFNGAYLLWAKFNGAGLLLAEFNGANLFWAKFNGAGLQSAKFNGANLWGAEFNGANLTRADFSDTENFDLFYDEKKGGFAGNEGLKRKFKDCYCHDDVKANFPIVPEGFKVKFALDGNGKPEPHPTIENSSLIEIIKLDSKEQF